jgi:prevent-host-death family protein
MQRIKLDTDIRPLSEFRANIASVIEEVRRTKRPIVITQHGKSAAVMLDVSEYEALLEKIELLRDIHVAEKQLQDGKGISHSEVKSVVRERNK